MRRSRQEVPASAARGSCGRTMVVPGGGARLVVLLVLLVLAPDPLPWGARAASPADDTRELQQGAAQQTAARRYLSQELHDDGEERLEEDDEVAAYDPAAVEKMVTGKSL